MNIEPEGLLHLQAVFRPVQRDTRMTEAVVLGVQATAARTVALLSRVTRWPITWGRAVLLLPVWLLPIALLLLLLIRRLLVELAICGVPLGGTTSLACMLQPTGASHYPLTDRCNARCNARTFRLR